MNEATFSRWIVSNLREQSHFVQRLEVTTGSGVPDLCALGCGKTLWLELKWNTNHIRPEQHVWGHRALLDGNVRVFYLCGYEKGTMALYHFSKDNKPMKNTFKLTALLGEFPRKKSEIPSLIKLMHHESD